MENDQDNLFVSAPNMMETNKKNKNELFMDFDVLEVKNGLQKEENLTETVKLKSVQNPFQDNLANSDILPKIQKLDVQINENYISKLGTTENASSVENKESAH